MRVSVANPQAKTRGRSLLTDDQWRSIAASLALSPRELQIVQHVFDDDTEADIARQLGISAHTVHSHVKRVHHKLGVHDRCALVLRVFAAYISRG